MILKFAFFSIFVNLKGILFLCDYIISYILIQYIVLIQIYYFQVNIFIFTKYIHVHVHETGKCTF